MKSRDVAMIIIVGIIFAIAGVLLVGQIGGGNKKRSVNVEVVEKLPESYDESAKDVLKNSEIQDFTVNPDLNQGLGTTDPFAQ